MKLYQHCSELPLSRFIECLCEGKYSVLLIEGDATEEQLKEAWDALYNEYLDATAKNGSNDVMTLLNEFDALYYKYAVVEKCVEILRWYNDDRLIAILKERGFNFPFDDSNVEQYLKDLDRVMTRSKKFLVDMEIRRKQLDAIQKANSGAKIDRAYFDTILVTLSKFAGYHVNEEVITVSRYVALLNMYINHCKQITAKQDGRSDR